MNLNDPINYKHCYHNKKVYTKYYNYFPLLTSNDKKVLFY